MPVSPRLIIGFLHVAVWAIALSSSASCALATDRFYSDLTVYSPAGQYRFEAKSPSNADGKRVPFQRDFAYTLADARTDQTLWTRKQAKGEASPVRAWVHDAGWVVVWTGRNDFMAFSSTSAKPTSVVNVLKQFPEDEHDKYVHQTTAGPMWSQSARWYFADIDGKPHFVIRAWWGRRVIIELASGRVVPDEGAAHDAVISAEHADIVAILERAAKENGPPIDLISGQVDWRMVSDITTAAHLAGREQIKEAAPSLLKLEKWDLLGGSSIVPVWINNPLSEGTVDPFSWSEFTLRFKVQTALRRLGQTPAGLPATQFRYYHKQYKEQQPVVVTLDGTRAEHVDRVKTGMSPLEVLEAVNAPDAVVAVDRSHAWEYDIDAAEPFTMRVQWTGTNPPTVSKVTHIQPPAWQTGETRDND